MNAKAHAPNRRSARRRGAWTLTEPSVECGVMSGLAATGADEACCAEQREGAVAGAAVGAE